MSRDVDQSHKEITEVEHIARTALKEVREAIRGYRADGLVAEIARARTVLQAAGVSLDCDIRPMAMRPADETILSLVLREAVTNIVRHSGASTCRVEFQKGPSSLNLNVQDNGRGQIREEGNGLRGMRERVQSIGGTMTLDSERGTRLEISLPVNS